MPALAAWTGRTRAALAASTCAACSPSLQHHIQIFATAARETPVSEESRERDGAGLGEFPGQGPQAFLPI